MRAHPLLSEVVRAVRGPNTLLPRFMMWARPTGLKPVVNFGTSFPSSQAKPFSQ